MSGLFHGHNRGYMEAALLHAEHEAYDGGMKQILAVVRPHVAEKVVEALRRGPIEAITVREVKGYGRQKDYLDQYGQSEYALAFLPKVELMVWVDDARVEEVAGRIQELARTARIGDGKIVILPVTRFEQWSETTEK